MTEREPVVADGIGTITEACGYCGESITVPNKGLGRAKLYAWRTRHQPGHERESSGSDE